MQVTGRRAASWAAPLVLALGTLSGCGGAQSDDPGISATGSSTPAVDGPSPTVTSSRTPSASPLPENDETEVDGGISASEASDRGVLTGPYDALLTLAPDRTSLTLENVGQQDDSYTLRVRPPGAAELGRSRVDVGSGDSVAVPLSVATTPATILVRSAGRDGETIATLEIAD